MTDAERLIEAEKFVRRALSHTGSKVDDASVKKAAEQIVKAMPTYQSAQPNQTTFKRRRAR